MKSIFKYIIVFGIGAIGYWLIEASWRYITNRGFYTHPIMALVGGISLLSIYIIETHLCVNIIIKSLFAAAIITTLEFIIGYIFTYILESPLWRYGTLDFMGIVSLSWSALWCLLSMISICCIRLIKFLEK